MGPLREYLARVTWTGAGAAGTASYTSYGRDHQILFDGPPPLSGSADPAFRGDPRRFSPERLFVASLAQCHMLWFLHVAAESDVVVRGYEDDAAGTMRVESGGEGQFVSVTLRPRVRVDAPPIAHRADLADLHERAHAHCFLARSVNFPVLVEPAPLRIG